MNEQELFSQIPMRTWRWLGVNDIKEPAGLAGEPHRHQIVAQPGADDEVTLELRESGRHEVQAHVGKGARLHLTALQLAAEDVPVTCRIKVLVDEGGLFSYTGVEAGASETAAELTVHLAGDDARADVWSFYFGDGDRKLDLNYIIRQSGKRTDANMQVRGALLGKSVKNFRGTTDINACRDLVVENMKNADKTCAYVTYKTVDKNEVSNFAKFLKSDADIQVTRTFHNKTQKDGKSSIGIYFYKKS